MPRLTARLLCFAWITVLTLSLSGCTLAVNVPPTASGVTSLPIREKLPLRAAIVMTTAEMDATHEVSFGHTLRISGFGRNLAESLRTSVAVLFRDVALVTTEAVQGFDVALRPKVRCTGPAAPENG